jgi:hypothetical protein
MFKSRSAKPLLDSFNLFGLPLIFEGILKNVICLEIHEDLYLVDDLSIKCDLERIPLFLFSISPFVLNVFGLIIAFRNARSSFLKHLCYGILVVAYCSRYVLSVRNQLHVSIIALFLIL